MQNVVRRYIQYCCGNYTRMYSNVLVFLSLSVILVSSQSEYLIKKFCDDVSPHMCEVYNVILEPCFDGGSFCTIKRTKGYTLTIDFMPKFLASKLNISMAADDRNVGAFDKVVKAPRDACEFLTCPIEPQERRLFDVDFSLGKTFAVGKYPVKVKVFNPEESQESCCFTFNVKTKK